MYSAGFLFNRIASRQQSTNSRSVRFIGTRSVCLLSSSMFLTFRKAPRAEALGTSRTAVCVGRSNQLARHGEEMGHGWLGCEVHCAASTNSGQIVPKSLGNSSFRLQIPRDSAMTASRINLSSGMRPLDFQSDTDGGFKFNKPATAFVPPNSSISVSTFIRDRS